MTSDEITALARSVAQSVAQSQILDELRKDREALDRRYAEFRLEMLETLRHNERETNNGFVHHGDLRRAAIEKLQLYIDTHFVQLLRYQPLERLAYSTVSLVLLTVLGWLLALVYQQSNGGAGR